MVFTRVPSWCLLMSRLRYLVHRCFNRMEILGLYLILIIKWSLWRADHLSRGVLPTVVHRYVWSRKLVNEEALAHWGGCHTKNIQNVKWSESLLAPRWLLTSVICEACPLLIMTWSIWVAASPSGDIQVWKWIFLCEKMVLLMTRSLEVTKSH